MDNKRILESLPDFDTMDEIAKKSAEARFLLEQAKNILDEKVARCINEAQVNELYWSNGKPPSMAFCNSVVSILGNTKEDAEELKKLREDISKYTQLYQEYSQLLDNMKDRIAVWRTFSANQRKVLD